MNARKFATLVTLLLIGTLCALRMAFRELDATRRENMELRSTLAAHGLLPESEDAEGRSERSPILDETQR